MFALGVLSLVQMCFLPGFLLTKFLRVKSLSSLGVLVLSFGLSLVVNLCVIFPMTALGLYTRPLLAALMLLETVLLVLLMVRRSRDGGPDRLQGTGGAEQRGPSIGGNPFAVLVLLLASCWFLSVFVKNIGTVFTTWDAVVSWNRWARDWAANRLPFLTWQYPQLLPANWSISYVLMGTELQFFPKAIMPLFSLFMMLLFLDLALRTRETQYIWGFVITGVFYRALLPEYVPTGYAECAVAFLAFASVYCLISAGACSDAAAGRRWLVVGAILAGGCAVTKQAGLYMVAAYPVLAYVLILHKSPMTARERIRLVALCVACILIIAGPWYVYKEIQIAVGKDQSVVELLTTDLHKSRALLPRLTFGIGAMGKELGGTVGLVSLLATLILGLWDRKSFWITWIVIVPFTLIWGFFFSYSVRNYSLALPLLALVCGKGIARFWTLLQKLAGSIGTKAAKRLLPRATLIRATAAVVLAGAVLVLGSVTLTGDRMLHRQEALQRVIGYPEVNNMVYGYAEHHSIKGKILTDYQLLGYLPGLAQYKAPGDIASIPKEEYAALLTSTAEDPERYLLFSSGAYPQLLEAVRAACETGQCEVVGACKSWYLVKVQGGPATSSPAAGHEAGEPTPQ